MCVEVGCSSGRVAEGEPIPVACREADGGAVEGLARVAWQGVPVVAPVTAEIKRGAEVSPRTASAGRPVKEAGGEVLLHAGDAGGNRSNAPGRCSGDSEERRGRRQNG